MSYIALKSGNMYYSEDTSSKRTYSKYAAKKFSSIQAAMIKREELLCEDRFITVVDLAAKPKYNRYSGKRPIDIFPDEDETAN